MNGWKGARLGRLGICCVKKKKNVLWKYTLLWHLFFCCCWLVGFFCCCYCFSFSFVFKFYFFLPSQTWMLGFSLSRLQKFCALFFVCLLRSFFFFSSFSFVRIYFSPKKFWIFFFFSKISHFGICLLGFLRIFFSPDFVVVFAFFVVVIFWRNCFLFKVQFHKRRTSTV